MKSVAGVPAGEGATDMREPSLAVGSLISAGAGMAVGGFSLAAGDDGHTLSPYPSEIDGTELSMNGEAGLDPV